jgi:hypothetical protein
MLYPFVFFIEFLYNLKLDQFFVNVNKNLAGLLWENILKSLWLFSIKCVMLNF